MAYLCAGLGNLHVLGDDLVLQVIGQLDARDLANASLASKALYCFAGFEDCWKALVLEVRTQQLPAVLARLGRGAEGGFRAKGSQEPSLHARAPAGV